MNDSDIKDALAKEIPDFSYKSLEYYDDVVAIKVDCSYNPIEFKLLLQLVKYFDTEEVVPRKDVDGGHGYNLDGQNLSAWACASGLRRFGIRGSTTKKLYFKPRR